VTVVADSRIVTDIIANDRASRVFGQVGSSADRAGSRLAGLGRVAGLALGGAAVAGVAALGAAMVGGVKAAADYQTLGLKTAAVLKSTGNAAGTSVAGIQDLASALETMSGVDEELIINSQNVLATFTKIKNQGPNRVFDDAAKAALNMSVALGTDLQGATLQVGKALNDPIKGVTALRRAGVSFTASQLDQIKTMQESGDLMGAQKLILGELSTEFGGAAKAAGSGFAGSMARVKDSLGDAARQLGTAMLPTLTKLGDWLATKGVPGLIAFAKEAGPKVAGAFRTAWNAIKPVASFLTGTLWPAIQAGVDRVMPLLKTALGQVKLGLASFGKSGGDVRAIMAVLWPVLKIVGGILGGLVVANILRTAVMFRGLAAIITGVVLPGIRLFLSGFLLMVSGVLRGIELVFSAGAKIPGKLGAPFRAALPSIKDARAAVDGVRSAMDRVRSKTVYLTVSARGSAVSGGSTGKIALARGGIVREHVRGIGLSSGKQYDIGEAGPEVVSPMDGRSTVMPGAGSVARGGQSVTVNIYGAVDPAATARQVDQVLTAAKRQGWRPIPGGAFA
jgi:Prophage tail length tape measure protein